MILNLLRGLAMALAIGCAVVMVRMGEPSSFWWWPWSIFLYLWNISPVALGVIAAGKVRREPFTLMMMAYLLVSALAVWICIEAVAGDMFASIIFLFLPVVEWGALIVLIMIASRIGWFGAK
jgi:hypothetical protein